MCFLSKVLMFLTNLMRFRVLTFLAAIIACTFISRPDFTTNVEASEIRSTNKKHFRQGPKKGKPGMFGAQGKKYRTRIIEAPKRGLIASNPQPLFKAASLERVASKACREGKLRRFGGGVAEFGGRIYPAATLTDIARQAGIELEPGIYIFVSEGSTGCQVFLFEE
tara:strand:- start:604 stop:1101 length:498 start_codon:yes stop_codon:yes gene_type:complete